MSHRVRRAILFLLLVFINMHVCSAYGDERVVGLLTIHGVGSQHVDTHFDAQLRAALATQQGKDVRVVVKTICYHGDSRQQQSELWKKFDRMEDDQPHSLDQRTIRRLMLASVADALAYGSDPGHESSYYLATHMNVRCAIDELAHEMNATGPIVVVAHSLGCKIIFDYLCDAQTGQGIWQNRPGPTDLQKLNHLRLMITMGCNLPFFESALPAERQRFFAYHKDFRWINYYDRDDVLGWPLQPLGGQFAQVVTDEERGKLGTVLTAHTKYWRDDALNRELAREILKVPHVDTP